MAIHHDKLAYGKLEELEEALSEEEILAMLAQLNSDEGIDESDETEETAKKETKRPENKKE